MYHELAESSDWVEEVYVELQYAAIIEAVKEDHFEEAEKIRAWRERQTWGKAEFESQLRYNSEEFAKLSDDVKSQ